MATTGTGPGSTGKGTKDWSTTAGQQTGQGTRDRRPAGEQNTTGNMTGSATSTGSTAASTTESGTGTTSGITQTLKDTTRRSIDDQKVRAGDTLGSLAGAVRGMSQPLRDGGQGQMAEYVNKAADGIERWATNLKQQDLEDAVRAVEQFARRQPAMFLGIAFGAGLIAARFLKSSSADEQSRYYGGGSFDTGAGSRGYDSPGYGSTGYGSTGTGSTGSSSVGSTGLGGTDFGGGAGAGSRGTTSGDIPRVSSTDIRPTGEVL